VRQADRHCLLLEWSAFSPQEHPSQQHHHRIEQNREEIKDISHIRNEPCPRAAVSRCETKESIGNRLATSFRWLTPLLLCLTLRFIGPRFRTLRGLPP
jgi:hypothetical protein